MLFIYELRLIIISENEYTNFIILFILQYKMRYILRAAYFLRSLITLLKML